ncbi:MAG: hypothetical protein HY749_00935 [Gammaproteobacteria bacterium]|nr:hypothetical protein [Gammaproteobacteria bacterium]
MKTLLILFVGVYALNIVPAFAPPTWMAMSWLGFNRPHLEPLLIAVVAAVAATLGRLTLAVFAKTLVRNRLIGARTRENLDVVREAIEARPKFTVGAVLLYAFTPFPSNYLFIAYGLTALPLPVIAVPFFLGRLVSYTAWATAARTAARYLGPESDGAGTWFSGYFVVTQLVFLFLLYAFVKIDWRELLGKRHELHWLAKRRDDAPRD